MQYVPFETKKENEEKSLWERAWDSLKETASDVWDTVTSKEFREKALAIGGTILVATGTNLIAKGAYELFGNENWTEEDFLNLYWEGKELLYMGAYAYVEFGANAMAAGYSSQKSEEGSGIGKTQTGTVWDHIISTADDRPNTKIPATFETKLNSNINYTNPENSSNSVWTNANATKHMGEYISRMGAKQQVVV